MGCNKRRFIDLWFRWLVDVHRLHSAPFLICSSARESVAILIHWIGVACKYSHPSHYTLCQCWCYSKDGQVKGLANPINIARENNLEKRKVCSIHTQYMSIVQKVRNSPTHPSTCSWSHLIVIQCWLQHGPSSPTVPSCPPSWPPLARLWWRCRTPRGLLTLPTPTPLVPPPCSLWQPIHYQMGI